VPKVACPLHKKTFSLETGDCLSDADYSIRVVPVKVEGDEVYLELPPQHDLDGELATELHCVRGCDSAAPAACVPFSDNVNELSACVVPQA
jgi:hypothetical protein